MTVRRLLRPTIVLLAVAAVAMPAMAQYRPGNEASSSLMAQAMRRAQQAPLGSGGTTPGGAVDSVSLFRVPPPEPRLFRKHDLVQIVVRESSTARSSQELDTEKEFEIAGRVNSFPHLVLEDLINLQLYAGRTDRLPTVGLGFGKNFEGEGEYERRDDMTARITAEVIDIQPNGNLVLEARTRIVTDEEKTHMIVTGLCRPEDVTDLNTVLSNQIHELKIEKIHSGELKKANEKGIVAKFFDILFAW